MNEGDTPLIDAARHGRAADVEALLADGADVNEPKTDGSGMTALWRRGPERAQTLRKRSYIKPGRIGL